MNTESQSASSILEGMQLSLARQGRENKDFYDGKRQSQNALKQNHTIQ